MSVSRVLQNPDNESKLILSIAGLKLLVDEADRSHLPLALRDFVVEAESADLQYRGRSGVIDQAKFQAAPLFDSGGLWQVYGDEQSPVLALQYADKIYQYARFNQSLTEAELCLDLQQLRPGVSPFSLRQPLLELWYTFWLMRGHGSLLHACGVRDAQGFVDVFVGVSGAGKSTFGGIVASAKAGDVLSDDRLIVRREPASDGQSDSGAYRVYGTPWHGEARFAQPASGILRSINFLQQARESRREPMGIAEAAQRLFTCQFLAGWPRDQTLNFALEQCALLVGAVPCYLMPFRPDDSALQVAGLHVKQARLIPDAQQMTNKAELKL